MTGASARNAFAQALNKVPYAVMLHALEQHKRSEQWRQHIVPSMTTWLIEERWCQTLPEPQLSPADQAQRHRSTSPFTHARRLGLKR